MEKKYLGITDMSQTQLDTAAKLTKLRPVQHTPTRPPRARHPSIALTATPAPAMGPEDELLFDPDEESYGDAGPGAGYVASGTNIPLGVQTSGVVATTTAPAKEVSTEPPLIVDLSEPVAADTSSTQKSFFSGAIFWIVLIATIVTCSLCLMFVARGSSPSSQTPDFGGLGGGGSDPGFGSGGYGGGLGGSGLGGLDRLGGLGGGGLGYGGI